MAKRKVTEPDGTVEEVEVPDVEAAPKVTAEEQAVIDATAAVADAQKTLDEAMAGHKAATEAQAEAVAAAEPKPEKGKHIFVEGANGTYLLRDAPEGYNGDAPDRRIVLRGVNYEHVSDHPSGIWVYRAM